MDIGQAIHHLPLAAFLRASPWAYPAVETVHLVAIALLFGSIVVVDLRILGLSRDIPMQALARHALPWTLVAFLMAVATGLLLFVAHAADLVSNRIFILKLGLIGVAGINAAMFHTGPYVRVTEWNLATAAPLSARAMAMASILLWVMVIGCGRWIAYA